MGWAHGGGQGASEDLPLWPPNSAGSVHHDMERVQQVGSCPLQVAARLRRLHQGSICWALEATGLPQMHTHVLARPI